LLAAIITHHRCCTHVKKSRRRVTRSRENRFFVLKSLASLEGLDTSREHAFSTTRVHHRISLCHVGGGGGANGSRFVCGRTLYRKLFALGEAWIDFLTLLRPLYGHDHNMLTSNPPLPGRGQMTSR
jgi:hypothetical protein